MPHRHAAASSDDFSVRAWLSASATRASDALAADSNAPAAAAEIAGNEILREESVRYTVQLLVAERCSLAASAGLINATADERWKRFLASQVLDEALHMELFTERLRALGVAPETLEDTVVRHAHPDLLGLSQVVLAPVHDGDFLGGLVAQSLILDEILTATYELLRAWTAPLDPRFAGALGGLLADEARHGAFAESIAAELIARHPDRKTALASMQRDVTRLMVNTFAEAFRDNPMPAELRRVLLRRPEREPSSWAGIDPVASSPAVTEAMLERVVSGRIRDRFARLGVTYRRAAA